MKAFFVAFKSGFKQYWHSLRYILPIVGLFAIVIAIVLTLSIGNYIAIINNATGDIRTLFVDKYHLTQNAVNEFINEISKHIDFTDPFATLQKLTNPTFIQEILDKCPSFKDIATTDLIKDIQVIAENFRTQFVAQNQKVLLGIGIGLIVSYIAIQWFMDKQIKGSNVIKFIISFGVKIVLALVFIGYSMYVSSKFSLVVSFLLMDLFYIPMILISMLEARIFYSKKYIETKEIFNFPNLIGIFASSLIIYGISATLTGILFTYTGPLVGFIVGLPLIEISYIVTSTSARYLVGGIVEERKGLEPKKSNKTKAA